MLCGSRAIAPLCRLVYSMSMAKIATKLEDIGDERDQAVFMATVKLWFNGDFQAALINYNEKMVVLEKLETETDARKKANHQTTTEVRLRIPHQ